MVRLHSLLFYKNVRNSRSKRQSVHLHSKDMLDMINFGILFGISWPLLQNKQSQIQYGQLIHIDLNFVEIE